MGTSFHLLFLFAAAAAPAMARDVTVRLYFNQTPSQLTLTRGANSVVVHSGGARLHVTGPWRIQLAGQDPVALSNGLEIRTEKGHLALTITLPLEEYVAAVLAGESAGFRSEQALAAMAVAARTYAVNFQGRHKSEGFDFCDTTHCQDLRIGALSPRTQQAAAATEGELLWFAGSPASTFYGKDCGGVTEGGALVWPELKAPYLKGHDDPYCRRSSWTSSILKKDLSQAVTMSGFQAPRRLDSLTIAARTPSGRAARLQSGGFAISASSLRFAVGRALGWSRLRSDLYELADAGDRFVFEGRGDGNGVGLCQSGADRMGQDGRSYRQILEFYYPGTALGVAAQGFSWQSLAGERVTVITTRPGEDRMLVTLADQLASAAEQRSGLRWTVGLKLRVYPTVAAFRDATGEPGWVAASSRGSVIRLQPVSVLQSRGTLENTVQHELLHVLVESHARPGLPLWFREGVVEFLTARQKANGKRQMAKVIPPEDAAFLRGRVEAQRAYAAALDCVADLVDRFGEPTVLSWLDRGLPGTIRGAE